MEKTSYLFENVPQKLREQRLEDIDKIHNTPLPEWVEEYLKFKPHQREDLASRFTQWLNLAEKWVNDPTSVNLSMQMIQGHPALWHFVPPENSTYQETASLRNSMVSETGNCIEFDAQRYYSNMDLEIGDGIRFGFFSYETYPTPENTIRFTIECGEAIPPFRDTCYHNYFLDDWGDSFEEVYVRSARNFFRGFGFGSEFIEEDYRKQIIDMATEEE